jgi:hypothetical protein
VGLDNGSSASAASCRLPKLDIRLATRAFCDTATAWYTMRSLRLVRGILESCSMRWPETTDVLMVLPLVLEQIFAFL